MNAECTDWSVTIYADRPEDIFILRALCDRARRAKISFGSVGIFPNPPECQPEPEDLVRFVGFSHKTWGDLAPLIFQDGMPADLKARRVRAEWKDELKLHSRGNRRARLSCA